MSDAGNALFGSGHDEEFIRVARILFEAIDWIEFANETAEFDEVLSAYIQSLDQLEQHDTVDNLFERYEKTVSAKTVRYIRFCNVRCYSAWTRSEFSQALEWGQIGQSLNSRKGKGILDRKSHGRDECQPQKSSSWY